jgi:hypothetical protein
MNKRLALLGLILIAAAGLWYFWLAPSWTQRLPPGWTWQTYSDPASGEFPEKSLAIYYEHNIHLEDETRRPILASSFIFLSSQENLRCFGGCIEG